MQSQGMVFNQDYAVELGGVATVYCKFSAIVLLFIRQNADNDRGKEQAVNRLTALIPCKNEELHIAACLESVAFADEILVVDSFSTDRTVEFAKRYTDRVLVHEYVNSAAQKNWAIPQATHDWILIVDADERVTPELAAEIKKLLAGSPTHDAYAIYRRNHFLGKEIKHCGWDRDRVIRLFRKSVGSYPEQWVHADLQVKGTVAVLRERLLHYTCVDYEQYINKWERYTTWAAKDIANRRRRISALTIASHATGRFFRQYLVQRGFLDGREGFIICALAAGSVFLKYSKAWALLKHRDH